MTIVFWEKITKILSLPFFHSTFFFEQMQNRIFGQIFFGAEKIEILVICDRPGNFVNESSGRFILNFRRLS